MKTLALITFDFTPEIGGVQSYLSEIVSRLATDCEVHVLTVVPAGNESKPGIASRHQVPSGRFVEFWRLLRRIGPEQVLVGHAHPQLLLAAFLSRRPFAALAYGNDYLAAQGRWHRILFNHLLRRARPVITISQANATRLHSLGINEAEVVYPGTDPGRFTPLPAPLPFPPRLLTVSRLVPRKGIDTVIRALPQIRRYFPDVTYIVAGDGPDRTRLEGLAAAHGVSGAVEFLGSVSEARLPSLYREAHVFVMPVRESEAGASLEGFGIVFLEASASGLPIVAGRSGGAVEAVKHGKTGILVNPHDHDEFALVIRGLLRDGERRRQLGECGRAWVETEMNWDRAAREITAALKLAS